MRVAVSVDDTNGLDSVVSPHFGRCPHYALVDLNGREIRQVVVVENPNYGRHQPGAVPRFIDGHDVDVMLAGGMGRRAIGLFQQLGIEAVTGASGTVRRALEQYLGGALEGAEACRTSAGHGHQGEPVDEGAYEQDDLGRLREEMEMLQQQLDEAMGRLQSL